MKIVRNDKLATWTLVPVEEGEIEILASIAAVLKPEDKLSYGGREQDGGRKFCLIHLHAGAKKERQSKTEGNITINQSVYVGGVELVLRGSTEEDKDEVGSIRDSCFFGGEPIYLGETEVDGKKAIVITGGRCKFCGAGLLEPEWNTCDACAAKCEHNYIRGVIHGGGTDIGVGEFCDICGRGKKIKGERKKTIIEQHLNLEKELGIPVIHGVGRREVPLTTQEVVEINRLTRRHTKSLQRKVSK
jgi:hypothetical protein